MIDLKRLNHESLNIRIAEFEAIHGSIETACPEFVDGLATWIEDCLTQPDLFIYRDTVTGEYRVDDDRIECILLQYSEDGTSVELDNLIYAVHDKFHEIMLGDEFDNLIVELISAIVDSRTPKISS